MGQASSQRKSLILPKFNLVVSFGILSVVLALIASFRLANWAEASSLHHGIQHVLLVVGGIGIGSSVTLGIKQRKEN